MRTERHPNKRPRERNLAGAPISWGVCEVPGWGRQLPPERVLGEMASLGLTATELGPVGYLSLDPSGLRGLLDSFGLGLVAAFVPVVLHRPSTTEAEQTVDRVSALLTELGGEVLTLAPVMDDGWSSPTELGDEAWRRLAHNLDALAQRVARHGLTPALHPHAETVIESQEQIERILAASEVPCCLDTGHLVIGGVDPVEFMGRHGARVVHVHLKDVDSRLAEQVRSRALSLVEATRQGMFRPLGSGDVAIADVVDLLDRNGYERWLVLEQDTTLTGEEPPVGGGPVLDVRTSIEYLAKLAPANGEGIPRA